MQVTDVKIRQINPAGRMKALASVTLDDDFVVHDVRIVEGHNGLFVAMPSRRLPDGQFRDIAHPINGDFRRTLETVVLGVYEAERQKGMVRDDG